MMSAESTEEKAAERTADKIIIYDIRQKVPDKAPGAERE